MIKLVLLVLMTLVISNFDMLVVYNQLHPSSFYLNLFHSVYYSIHTDFFHRHHNRKSPYFQLTHKIKTYMKNICHYFILLYYLHLTNQPITKSPIFTKFLHQHFSMLFAIFACTFQLMSSPKIPTYQ